MCSTGLHFCSSNNVKIRISISGHLSSSWGPSMYSSPIPLKSQGSHVHSGLKNYGSFSNIYIYIFTSHVQLGHFANTHEGLPQWNYELCEEKDQKYFFFASAPQLVLDYSNDDVIVQKTPKKWLMLLPWNVGGNKCRLAFSAMITSQEDSALSQRFYHLSVGRKTKALLVFSISSHDQGTFKSSFLFDFWISKEMYTTFLFEYQTDIQISEMSSLNV